MIILVCCLAFYVAWNLGANDVANAMGTSVGSGAVTLRQALVIAGILEFAGAILFGQHVSQTLTRDILSLDLFAAHPQVLLVGMLAVLIACGLWLNLATALSLPVSSSHAVVGAIAGVGWTTAGASAIHWSSIRAISLTWVITPVVSGAIAALFYSLIKHWILDQPQPVQQLAEWIPWLSAGLFTLFGSLVLPTLVQQWHLGLLPDQTWMIGGGAIATCVLTFSSWRFLSHTSAAELGPPVERVLSRFQVCSACFVAFAHGSNDVGNAVAPVAAIVHIQSTGTIPPADFSIPAWILVLGGAGIVAGLAVWGRKVIATVGEGITALQPSGGFCAELATAATVLIASRLGLPVSTSHALVGGVVGIGLVKSRDGVQLGTLRSIATAWLVTIPVAMALGAGIFSLLQQFFQLPPLVLHPFNLGKIS